jgi:hypothetical protein
LDMSVAEGCALIQQARVGSFEGSR